MLVFVNYVCLITNYLSNHTHKVILKADVSSTLSVMQGIPQRSILGPLLFLLYLENIHRFVKKCVIHHYLDDDLNHLFNNEWSLTAQTLINDDLNDLFDIYTDYKLKINSNKSLVVIFGSKN